MVNEKFWFISGIQFTIYFRMIRDTPKLEQACSWMMTNTWYNIKFISKAMSLLSIRRDSYWYVSSSVVIVTLIKGIVSH